MTASPAAPRETDHITDPRYQGIGEAMGYKQDDARLKRVRYNHDAMIDIIIADPGVSQNQLATMLGFSVPWVSRVMGSDSFQARLAQRRHELIDPVLVNTVEDKLKGLAHQSLEVVADKLAATQNPDLAIKALELSTKALGFGARDRGPAVQNNFVVQLPPKAQSAESWAEAAKAGAFEPEMKKIGASNLSTTVDRDPTVQPKSAEIVEG